MSKAKGLSRRKTEGVGRVDALAERRADAKIWSSGDTIPNLHSGVPGTPYRIFTAGMGELRGDGDG
jgi:hypothetical protein